jgi:hypothetical protein
MAPSTESPSALAEPSLLPVGSRTGSLIEYANAAATVYEGGVNNLDLKTGQRKQLLSRTIAGLSSSP